MIEPVTAVAHVGGTDVLLSLEASQLLVRGPGDLVTAEILAVIIPEPKGDG